MRRAYPGLQTGRVGNEQTDICPPVYLRYRQIDPPLLKPRGTGLGPEAEPPPGHLPGQCRQPQDRAITFIARPPGPTLKQDGLKIDIPFGVSAIEVPDRQVRPQINAAVAPAAGNKRARRITQRGQTQANAMQPRAWLKPDLDIALTINKRWSIASACPDQRLPPPRPLTGCAHSSRLAVIHGGHHPVAQRFKMTDCKLAAAGLHGRKGRA